MADLLSHAQLRARGLSDGRIWRLERGGQLVRVGRDTYVRAGEPAPVELVLARPGRGAGLCGASAGHLHGLPVEDARTHVEVANGSRRRWVGSGVVVHQTRREDWEVRGGVVVTTLARTAADLVRSLPPPEALAVVDAALRRGATAEEVLAALPRRAPGLALARRIVALGDARAESALESRVRWSLVDGGLPPPDLQRNLQLHGRFVARVDLWYAGIAIEANSFEFHSTREHLRRDTRRAQAIARLGLLYVPIVWEDTVGGGVDPAVVVRDALHRVRPAA